MCKKILMYIGIVFVGFYMYGAPPGWRSEIIVTDDNTQPYGNCCIATDSTGRIHVALRKMTGDEPECYDIDYYRSIDTGVVWNYISLEADGGTEPVSYRAADIVAKGNKVFIAFEQSSNNNIDFIKSDNGGTTWDEEETIVNGSSTTNPIHPRFGLEDSYTHVFYSYLADSGNYEIYRKDSTALNGWSSEDQITDATRNSWHPAVGVNADTIHLVWADNRDGTGDYEIFYNKSTNHGSSWVWGSSGYKLLNVDGVSEYPDIVAYSDTNYDAVHVVWMDDRTAEPGPGVYYVRSTNNGTNWGSPELLYADGCHPAIAADNQGLYVVFEKQGNLYYRESNDWGENWSTTVQITNTLHADSFPDIAADSLGRHIVFVRRNALATDSKIWYIQRDIVNPDTVENLRTDQSAQPPPPVNLVWDPNTDADLDEYKVYRALLGSPFYTNIGTTTDTTYTDYLFPLYDTSYVYYIRAIDLANNYSVPSDTVVVYIPPPNDRMNLGQSTASLFTILRDGYHPWGTGSDSTADYGELLKYRFTNLDPECDYTFGFGLFEPASDSGRILAIESGTHTYQKKFAVPESLLYACYAIPESFYSQGTVNVILTGEAYEAVLSEILIWEWDKKSGGPQSNNTIDVQSYSLDVYPTLTRGQVTIHYMLPSQTDGTIEIYDCVGKLIHSVTNLRKYSGRTVFWDGNKVSAGVYFVRLKTINANIIQKVIMVR